MNITGTATPTRTAASICDVCDSPELLSVSMRMDDGDVRFQTCTACESTWWERDGRRIPRQSALSAIPRR